MTKNKVIFKLAFFTSLVLIFQSCMKDKFDDISNQTENYVSVDNYADFNFKTIQEYDLSLSFLNTSNNKEIDGVYVELYYSNPLTKEGILSLEKKRNRIFTGISNSKGTINCKIAPPTYVDSLYVLTYYAGLPRLTSTPLNKEDISLSIGGEASQNKSNSFGRVKSTPTPTLVNGYYVLGGWNSYGVPDYLEPTNDVIDNDFLGDVNASLPEGSPLPQTHPQYLADAEDASLRIIENCNVWVTFVHEGAGWRNSLGYYTYPTNSPPSSVSDIDDLTIIFPDVSAHSNGLSAGNKVQLYYLDTESNEFSETFPAGTSVGWFLIAQGWSSSNSTITNGNYIHYSNVNLNVEADENLKKHNVLLFDSQRELLLLGFEDIRRDNPGCDQDFNDAVFFTSVNPITAVDNSVYQPIDNPTDSDGDGASDVFDEYPTDPTKAFNNYYPSEGTTGTLVYEDLWPFKGDYDFNDLVLDYNFNQVTNGQNEVTSIYSEITVRAIGASYHNAFGLSLNTSPNNVSSVTGQLNTNNYLDIAANGTENGQSKAVIILFDDAYNALPYPGSGVCVNTYPNEPYSSPNTLNIDIELVNAIPLADFGTPPYNPFIIINRDRGVEVHLPNLPPTDLVDTDLLGTGDDDSDIGANKYYVSDVYLPWAINLPQSFDYPVEKQDITRAHLRFPDWATSLGFNYMDWYQDKNGYRDDSKIYNK